MLSVSPQTLSKLEEASVSKSNERLVRYVETRFPDYFAREGEGAVGELITRLRAAASPRDVKTDRDLGTVADFSIMYGEDFWSQDWASDVFTIPHLKGNEKIAMLRRRVGPVLNESGA